jgi:ketosteroid isomerase-like protein
MDASRKRVETWFSSFQGCIGFEIFHLSITTGNDLAFSHGLCQVNVTMAGNGGKLDIWWRATVCCRKVECKWMITHEHNSAPFNPESGNASIDLKP